MDPVYSFTATLSVEMCASCTTGRFTAIDLFFSFNSLPNRHIHRSRSWCSHVRPPPAAVVSGGGSLGGSGNEESSL